MMEDHAKLAWVIVKIIECTCILNAGGILQCATLPYDRERDLSLESLLNGCKLHACRHL